MIITVCEQEKLCTNIIIIIILYFIRWIQYKRELIWIYATMGRILVKISGGVYVFAEGGRWLAPNFVISAIGTLTFFSTQILESIFFCRFDSVSFIHERTKEQLYGRKDMNYDFFSEENMFTSE